MFNKHLGRVGAKARGESTCQAQKSGLLVQKLVTLIDGESTVALEVENLQINIKKCTNNLFTSGTASFSIHRLTEQHADGPGPVTYISSSTCSYKSQPATATRPQENASYVHDHWLIISNCSINTQSWILRESCLEHMYSSPPRYLQGLDISPPSNPNRRNESPSSACMSFENMSISSTLHGWCKHQMARSIFRSIHSSNRYVTLNLKGRAIQVQWAIPEANQI